MYFCFLVFCFVFCFCRWNKLKLNFFPDPLYLIPFLRFSSAHIKIKSARIYWTQGPLGRVRARYCASVHSRAVKWSKTKGKTSVDIIFTSRHQVSLMMELIASPCPRIRVELRYVVPCLFVAGTCFTRTFPQLRSPPPSCQPRETDDVLYKNKEKLFSFCPAPLLLKVGDRTASNNTPSPGQKGCGCPGKSKTSNWTVHHWITF